MSDNQRGWMVAAVIAAVILAGAALAVSVFGSGGASFGDEMSAQGIRWGRIDNILVDHHLRVDEDAVISGPTALPTGTPALVVDNAGLGAALEVRDAGTPVWAVNDGGSVSQTGDQAITGDLTLTGDLSVTGSSRLAQATAATTATPAVVIDSSAAGANLLEVRDAATPVAYVPNGGGLRIDGGLTNIGGGTCGVADGDNDVCIAAVLEVDGELEVDGAIDADSTSDFADTATFSKGSGDAVVVSAGGTLNVNGVLDAVVGTEHLGVPSVITTSVIYSVTSGTIATVGDGEIWIVHAVLVNVTTDFDTAANNDATLIIGDGNDDNGFIDLADAELQAADTEGTGFAAGWQGLVPATQGVYVDAAAGSNYFIYAPSGAAETIDYAIGGTAADAGEATVYVIYTRIQ